MEEAGGEAAYAVCDVSDRAQVESVAELAVARFGRIDTWVAVAAVVVYADFEHTTPEEFRRLMEVNFMGQVHGFQAALPHLRRAGGGALVSVGSGETVISMPLNSAYAASKHAVEGMLDALRRELQAEHTPISVTSIKPAAINTPFFNNGRNKMEVKPKGAPPFSCTWAGRSGTGSSRTEITSPRAAAWSANCSGSRSRAPRASGSRPGRSSVARVRRVPRVVVVEPGDQVAVVEAVGAGADDAAQRFPLDFEVVGGGQRRREVRELWRLVSQLGLAAQVQQRAEADHDAYDRAQGSGHESGRTPEQKTCTADPVDIATGEFLLPETDLDLPGVLPMVLRRTHRSNYRFGR
ncbi:SDR family NAD(P)-dependent oxidoreductase [Nocardia asiatica]|uniref:SDR family NAD(P)-dependent oxidoreductase n=1 Tax=Nocardia asiatica TaxID=209252 RepID=UPI003EE0AB84